ncbi:hypothetical protein HPB50_023611 [Hyalomma asiaticum]|uniref:Uncharacterized protein n=1 Tax=Hyalomma asiaticum TaxID=266040 RepID=A0ACB7T4K5_HYAAI|nr:hypothetical protein HPB50_023611 [Hyalomma asiaticum]
MGLPRHGMMGPPSTLAPLQWSGSRSAQSVRADKDAHSCPCRHIGTNPTEGEGIRILSICGPFVFFWTPCIELTQRLFRSSHAPFSRKTPCKQIMRRFAGRIIRGRVSSLLGGASPCAVHNGVSPLLRRGQSNL